MRKSTPSSPEPDREGSCTGRIVLVTGGAQGLGVAYARHLRAAGAQVAAVDINAEALAALEESERGRSGSGGITTYGADVTNPADVARVVADVGREVGAVEVLINNAGGALLPRADFDVFTVEEWRRVLDLNLTSQWLCAAAVTPAMKEAGGGKIINVTSSVVERGYPVGMAPYVTAKAGVVGLTRALARELGPFGITVNAIAPGYTPVATPKVVHRVEQAEQLRDQMIDEQCLKRSETPEDLSPVVEFLVSPASDFISGQVIHVDGGWVTA